MVTSETPDMNGAHSPNQGQQKSPRKIKSDDNASFLRAARAGNLEKVLEYLKTDTDINICNPNGLNALHLASKEGHVHVVNELLSRGAKIDSATKKGNTALHIASLAGQEEVVKILIEHGSSVNVQSQNGFTPLYMAAQENHDGVVRFLLQSGANQSLATEDGFTPLAVALQQGHDRVVAVLLENDTRGKVRLPALHIAAKKDDTKAAGLLLQNDHNPDVTSKSGFTPLHIASHYGNESIAALLLTRNANVNYAAKHSITPLHVAAKWGKANMVQLLLDKGANLESKTRDGLTPLHCAARSGHENVVDVMIQRSAPISAKTKNGLAPLHMASQGDHVDAARILLHHKAPVDEVTVDYLTALHVAAHCGHVRVAKLLLDCKADPNARALNGFTPLHIACKKNRIKVVELLLKYGASIEATTESGLTPLHVASFMGCMNIVIYLIQHQASPDEATVRGETPLHLAARANQTDIIRILLRNGAKVDARAREQQTPLHIASRLGNVDIVVLLLQSGAQVDATTKDLYTALHIAAKEGQEEVAGVLIDHNASLTATTKKGFTPLHLAAKYGNIKVSRLLLQREAPVDAEGKNGVTPLHVAAHYDHQNVALLLLNEGASPHAAAKNGYTPLHITAKKNQLDIAKSLLEYGAKTDAESKAGFTPLHLAAQEGHVDMTNLLMKNGADVNAKAKNGLAPMHLCAQEDRVNVAAILASNGAEQDAETKAGYTPLHVASHFGSVGMVRFLLEQGVRVDVQNELGYTPLHQAAQQGHSQIVDLLLENNASPNTVSNNGQTALSIAQKLGYISVVETLKVVTEQEVTTTTTTTVEEKYRVMAPESMHETFLSDSEDEGGEENMLGDHSYKYLTADEMKSLGDDSMPIDVTHDEKQQHRDTLPHPQQIKTNGSMIVNGNSTAASGSIEAKLLQMEQNKDYSYNEKMFAADNVDLPVRTGVNIGSRVPSHLSVATSCGNKSVTSMWRERFLVSFMVDARGGAMRGCRHSGVRVIIPPRKAPMPMRITCRYLKKDKLIHPPPLMEGEAIASRILELGPAGAKFLGPVIIEVPHFASLRGKEREIVILRSDNGETWKEHTLEATEDAVQDVLQESFDADEMNQLEDLNTNRITRILTTDFPQYFAIVSRIRQEVHAIGPDGGVVNSTVVPQVQAVFPHGALTKKIKVGLQAQPIPPELTAKLLGNRVAVSPIVTVEPRRRKFHKAITLTIPLPQASGKGMLNDYSSGSPPNSLRLLCSITGGTTRAQWEDVTGSTPLTFVKDCVNFTTTVSARFWLMDCRNIGEATKFATELYREAIHVPFMAKFVVFAKRHDVNEARLRVFCMTDDKEEKTLENQEHFTEVAKSRDVEVLEGTSNFVEFGGNLVPVTKSGEQLSLRFWAFRENRLPFTVKVKDPHSEAMGRVAFMKEPKLSKQEAPQTPICNLNVDLPTDITPEPDYPEAGEEYMALQKKHQFLRQAGYGKFDTIHRADLRISDIGNLLGSDWVQVAKELEIDDSDINIIKAEYPNNEGQQGMVMLRLWLNTHGNRATGNELEKALRACNRDDIVDKCMFNVEMVTDAFEKQVAKNQIEEEVPGARLLSAPLKRVDAISEDEDEVHETITSTTTFEEKQGHDQTITEKQHRVVESENGETITTTTTTTTKRVISSEEEEYEKSQFDSSYERDEAKYLAEEKDPDSHQESSESEEEEQEEERIEVIEETRTEVAEAPMRTSTPPPSPLVKHEPMEEFQRGTETSLEEAVQIAAKDINDEAEVSIPVVEERQEYHQEEQSSSTRSSESQDEVDERMVEREDEVQESEPLEKVREVLCDVQKDMLILQSGSLSHKDALDKVEDIRQQLDDCKLSLSFYPNESKDLREAVNDLDENLVEIRSSLRPNVLVFTPASENMVVEMPATPQVESTSDSFLKPIPGSGSVVEMSDMSDASDNEEIERRYSITTPMEEKSLEQIQMKNTQETPVHSEVGYEEAKLFESDLDYTIQSFAAERGSLIDDSAEESGSDNDRQEENEEVISSTPDAEKYFQAHVRSQQTRYSHGDLDIEVGSLKDQEHQSTLKVKDLHQDDIFDIHDLRELPNLKVETHFQGPLSSYEALYDETELENVQADPKIGADNIRLAARHQGTFQGGLEDGQPSSYENIYQPDQDDLVCPPQSSSNELPSSRWSAPVSSIEPPILQEDEFQSRYGEVRDRIESHWNDLANIVGTAPDDTVEDTAEEFDQGDEDSLQFMVIEEKSEPQFFAERKDEVSEPVAVEEKETCEQFAMVGGDLREEVEEPMCVEKRVELLYDEEDSEEQEQKEEVLQSHDREHEMESDDEQDQSRLSSPDPVPKSDEGEPDDYYEGEVEAHPVDKEDTTKPRSRSSSSSSSSSSRKSSKSSLSADGAKDAHEELDDHLTTAITKTSTTTTVVHDDHDSNNDDDDDGDEEVDQNSDGKDSIIPRSDSVFRPEETQTQGSITPDLPLPETLCGSDIPSSTEQGERLTFGDKKKFWEQMSSTESMASSVSDHNLEAKASNTMTAQSPMTDIPEERAASFEVSQVLSKKINVDELSFSGIKSEWTKEELAEQLTPERKEHFETFVKPALEEDSNESSMEDKKMPLQSKRSSIDKDKFVTMQIKGDILESELDQQEESVMSEHFIEQNSTTIVSDTVTRETVSYEATEDHRTRIITNVTITETDLTGQMTETRQRSEQSVPEVDDPMPMTHVVESHEMVEKTANGSSKLRVHISSDSLLVDDDQLRQNRISTPHPVKKSIIITAPSEEDEDQDQEEELYDEDYDDSAIGEAPMDLETARDIASEVVANVGQEALKKVDEIRRSQEELDFEQSMPKPTVEVTFDEYFVVEDIPDEYDQIEIDEVQSVQETTQNQEHNMDEVKRVAQEFVDGIEEQAKELAERISPMGNDSETVRQQIETEKWREEDKAQSATQIGVSNPMQSEVSLEISDSDLQADLAEMQDELKRHYSEVEMESDEISASELHKGEGRELREEMEEGFEDVEERLNDVVDEVVMSEVSYHHYVPSHFPEITSFRSHFVRPFGSEDSESVLHQNLLAIPILESNQNESQRDLPSESHVFGSVQSHSAQDQQSTFISSTNSEDIWASEAKVMLRKDRIDHTKKSSEYDSSSSNSKLNRRSGTDFESGGGWSSSGDNYVTATASASALSRPSSSDMEAMYSAMSSAKSSTLTADYETAQGSSTHSALSTDYFTAVSSMTSKDSLRSLDTSESSGCLGSVEVSETTEPSEMLMDHSIHSERDLITPTGAPMEELASHSPIVSTMTPLVEDTSETDDEAHSPVILPNMKRSVEMVFNDVSEGDEKAVHALSESRETLNASILTISSGSEVTVQEIKDSSKTTTGEESFLAQGATPEESRCGSRESYQFPRVVSFETSVFDSHGHSELRGQKSFDSEFGSRPESELKILESRPQSMSEAMFSRSSSEDQRPSSKEDMSDSELPIMLRVKSDPFERPVTPEPCYEEEETILDEEENIDIAQAVEQDPKSEVEHNVEFLPGVEIMHAHPRDDDLLVESPPPIKSKIVSVSYWPPLESKEDSEETKGLLDNEEVYYTEDVEDDKEWLAQQFDSENKVNIEDEGYYFSPPLDQIEEEEEDHEKDVERLKTCLKESKDFDTSRFKRLDQMKATDRDDVSMSSLQEFEKLESQVSTCGGSRSSFGSQDSLEAGPIKVMKKNSKGDDISVDSYASLQEFEKLEQACHDVVVIEKMAKEQEDVLSEIEEGHESLYSESTDSAETLSEGGRSDDDNSDDFEERMFQIDEIIKQAQSNVEQFSTGTTQQVYRQTEMLPLEDILGKNDSNTDSTGADKTPSVGTPDSDSLEASPPKEGYHCEAYRKSVLSVTSAARDQDQMQTSVDSLDMNRHTNIMETSLDSLDGKPVAKASENTMVLSTDSIEQDSNNMYAMTKSTDSLEGKGTAKPSTMLKSTDSLEESTTTCSNNTRATASMLSSGASDTLVDDLEYDPAKTHPGMKKMLLASGEIHISDSDDNSISSKDTVDISHSQVSFGHHIREVIRTTGGDEEYSQVIERTIELPADVSRVSFRGPHAEEKMREYMSQFGTDDDVQEVEYVDDKGNVVKKKVVQHRVVVSNSKSRSQGGQFKEGETFGSSGEEYYEEIDEEGNKKQYVIKQRVEPVVQATKTIEVIAERRLQQGVRNPMELNIFKSGESSKPGSGSQGYWAEDVKGSPGGSASDVDDVIQRKMSTGHNEGESHA